ncbi:MAG: hypothetical protein JXB07_19070 [Anaerolineae bacterium]|nr:hypothetical protein [Anaerolineae bacterium]
MTTPVYHNSTDSYQRNNRRIVEGHDFDTATYWYRIDGGPVREFSSRLAMEKALDLELTPAPMANLDLPQLPARCPDTSNYDALIAKRLRRNRIAFQSKHGKRYPTRGVIALPASTTPEQPKPAPKTEPQHTPAQSKAIADFLNETETYFKLFSQAVNGNRKQFDLQRGQWKLRNAELAAGQAASRYAQFVGMGI